MTNSELELLIKQHKKQNKVIHKAQEKEYVSQQKWNETHNDLTRKMENYVKRSELWTLIGIVVSLIGLYLIIK